MKVSGSQTILMAYIREYDINDAMTMYVKRSVVYLCQCCVEWSTESLSRGHSQEIAK